MRDHEEPSAVVQSEHHEPPRLIGVTPDDGSELRNITSDIKLTFHSEMNPSTITSQKSPGPCSKNVQVSSDNFTTCLGGTIDTDDNIEFFFRPSKAFQECLTYKIKTTESIEDAQGTRLEATYQSTKGFITKNPGRWIEYNGNPLIEGGQNSGMDRAYYPFVIKVGSDYHLWYGDGLGVRHGTSFFRDFRDLEIPAPEVEVNGTPISRLYPDAYHSYVLYNETDWNLGQNTLPAGFVLYLTTGFSEVRAFHSEDGDRWTEAGLCTGITGAAGYQPHQGTDVYTFAVLYEGGEVWKGYGENRHLEIQYYTSTDGLNWTGRANNILGPPLNEYSSGWERGQRIYGLNINKIGDRYILFYSSGNSRHDNGIGMATSTDGLHFDKDTKNPILSIDDDHIWRNSRTYTPRLVRDDQAWLMYFSGVSFGRQSQRMYGPRSTNTNYSIGLATWCGAGL